MPLHGDQLIPTTFTVRRTMIRAVVIATAAVISLTNVAGASTHAKKLNQVTVGISSPSVTDVPMWVAQSKGIFAQHGMAVTLVPLGNSATVAAAMATGAIDYSLQSAYSVIESTASTLPFESISEYENALTVAAIVSTRFAKAHNITSTTPIATAIKALVGSKEGSAGATPLSEGNVLLAAYKVAPIQVRQVNIASAGAELQALQAGKIDWFVGSELAAYQAESEGDGIVIASNENAPVWSTKQLSTVLAANKVFANHHVRLTNDLVAAVNESVKWTGQHINAILNIAETNLPNYNPSVMSRALRDSIWPASGRQDSRIWNASLAFSIKSGLLPSGTKVQQDVVWTNKFIAG